MPFPSGSPKVLPADDTGVVRTPSALRLLGHDGNRVLTARDGKEALAAAEEHHPGSCPIDIRMPGPNAIEACRQPTTVPDAEGARAHGGRV
jgi:CheY-like chemotaxis protein